MDMKLRYGETLVETYMHKDVAFELVQWESSIWAGALGYAADLINEPDINGLLARYQQLAVIPKRQLTDPDWSVCISIDYWQNGKAPRGMIFAQQVADKAQDPSYDIYEMPASLYLRVACDHDSAAKLLGKAEGGVWEFFGCVREFMALHGYTMNDNGAQEIEMYCHAENMAYAYVPVKMK